MRDPRDIIKRPVVTERSTEMMEQRKYTFMVDVRANKVEIARAVEELFKVKVEYVHTMHVRGKFKRHMQYSGYRSDWKKAIVKLTKDSKTIPILETV